MFDFQLGRGRDGPAKFLKDWNGILQTDGYQAYDKVGGSGLIHVGCWAHARRKFVDTGEAESERRQRLIRDGHAHGRIVFGGLATHAANSWARPSALRCAFEHAHSHWWKRSIPSVLKLRSQLLPKSALGEAVNYTLNMWAKLRRCFDHAQVELSNNVAENSMRPVALGRKNWLHVGSAKSGPKVAARLSVVESCRRPSTSPSKTICSRSASRPQPQKAIGDQPTYPRQLGSHPP